MGADPHKLLLRLAWAIYLPMTGALLFAREPGTVRVADWARLGYGLAAATAIGLVVVRFSRYASRRTGWGRALFQEFRPFLAGLSSPQILALSLLSAFGEEALFRGALQPRLGLWIAALLFAGFHFPFRRRLVPWTLFAAVLGVVQGGLVAGFASLWPAIWLHFLVNFFNLHDLAGEAHPAAAEGSGAAGPGECP